MLKECEKYPFPVNSSNIRVMFSGLIEADFLFFLIFEKAIRN